MRMRIKDTLKKAILYCIVFSILIGTTTFAVTTANTIDYPNPKDIFNYLVETKAISHVFQKCIDSIPGPNSSGRTFSDSKKTIYDGQATNTAISTGAWIEKEVQGEVKDGSIYCKQGNDKILTLFAEKMGLSKTDILCNKDNHDYAGLIARYVYDNGSGPGQVNYDCSKAAYSGDYYFAYNINNTENTVYGQKYETGWDYIHILYNHWVKENKYSKYIGWADDYVGWWGNIDEWTDDAIVYRLMFKDFGATCGWHEQPNGSGDNTVRIKEITGKGEESNKYYQYGNSAKPGSITSESNSRTCKEMATRMNETFNAYKSEIERVFKWECETVVSLAWDFEVQKAKTIVSDAGIPRTITGVVNGEEKTWSNFTTDSDGNQVIIEFTEDEKKDAQAVLDKYNDMQKVTHHHGVRYWKTDEAPWECIAPPDYEIKSGTQQNNNSNPDQTDCYDAGVEGMSWILCPAVSNTSGAAGALEQVLRKMLGVDINMVFNDNVKPAWEVFRNFANAFLIIFFLFIIFSQLTGYGIDNYGIKKMLPKLIVMAVLINLSYLICQLAVDLSNILGVGLDNLFKNIGLSINSEAETKLTLSYFYAILMGLLASGGAIAGIAIGSGGGVMLIITLLLALLSALVALFMFFVTLSARTIIIIVFTIIAPVAFALYVLPNTQGLFKKWWKIFQAALVVFPICGALYGASYIIKAVVGSGNPDFVMGIVAIIAPVLPFMALPSLLKSALAGLGILGGAITALGNGFRKGTGNLSREIRNSDRLKEANARINAGYDKNGNRKWGAEGPSRWQRFWRGGKRNIERSALSYQKNESERGAREATEGKDFMLETETANEAKRIAASGEINSIDSLRKGLAGALTGGSRASIRAYTDALAAKGENGREAIREAYNDSVKKGTMSGESAKTFADNIMAKHSADFKNNDRTMFNIASDINAGKDAISTDAYVNGTSRDKEGNEVANIDKLREKTSVSTIGNMDNDTFEELYGDGTGITDKTTGRMAYEAMHGANAANIHQDRVKALQNIVKASGYTPDQAPAREGESFSTRGGETFEGGAGI